MKKVICYITLTLMALILFCLIFIKSSCGDQNKQLCMALIDGAISSNLPYYMNKIYINEMDMLNNKDDDLNGFVDDINGWNFREKNNEVFDPKADDHGTSLMFLLNGNYPGFHNLLEDVKCTVIPIKILSNNEKARIRDLISAIEYADAIGAKVCNLSIATSEENAELYETIKRSNMLFVVAAGNNGKMIDDINKVFPAMYTFDNVLTVGAMDSEGNISPFSNYSNCYVDLLALGENVLSKNRHNEWEYYDGTTYAAASISALSLKIIMTENPSSSNEIKKCIIRRAQKMRGLEEYVRYGIIE